MCTRLLLAFCVALAAHVVVGSATAAPPLPEGGGRCAGPLTLLVDRSASMSEHDPFGALRLALADALQASRPGEPGDAVRPFDARLGSAVPVGDGGWTAAMAAALAGGDRGATSLDDVAAELPAGGAGGAVVLLTDAEGSLSVGAARRARLAEIVVVGGAPAPSLASAARAAGVPLREVRMASSASSVVAGLCGGAAAGRPARDVVLVAGLGTTAREVRGAQDAGGCAGAALLTRWCVALVGDGARVWVPSIAPRRRGGARLDSTGSLATNASALTAWWLAVGTPEHRPVLIGHSMGGLIAHAALGRGLRAAGLVTVGTPHAGSYAADAYAAARSIEQACVLVCAAAGAALRTATTALRRRFGAALGDLTREQRTRVSRLGDPGIPLATWAGTTTGAPALLGLLPRGWRGDGYVVPNDGIVGQRSATGALAGLHPALEVDDGAARHSSSVPPAGAPTQLGGPQVAPWLLGAAQAMAIEPLATPARVAGAAPRRHVSLARAAAVLRSLEPLSATAAQLAGSDAVVVATRPIGVLCDDAEVPATSVTDGLWFVDVGVMGCRAARAAAPVPVSGGAWLLGGGGPGAAGLRREELVVSRRRVGGWSVRVRLARPGRLSLRRGRERVRLTPVPAVGEWAARLDWRAVIGARRGARSLPGARELRLVVRGAGAPRVASLWLP